MNNDNKNTILAIVLSAMVLIAWQYFFGMPQLEKQKQEQQQQQQAQQGPKPTPGQPSVPGAPGQPSVPGAPGQPSVPGQPGTPATPGQPSASGTPSVPGQPAAPPSAGAPPSTEQKTPGVPGQIVTREAAIAASPRVPIQTPSLTGSIALRGGRIDDLRLVKFRETVDPNSPPIVLLSPSGAPEPFYAEFGWIGDKVKLPTAETVWTRTGAATLTTTTPVTLTWDNGEGLEFRRTIAVDDKYLFTLKDEVRNTGAAPVTLYPYALVSRHGTPPTLGYYILHEGPIGVLGDNGLQEKNYKDLDDKKEFAFANTKGWLGFTDKYWATALLPASDTRLLKAKFVGGTLGNTKTYQADYVLDPQTIAPGATGSAEARLFAGAKEVAVVDAYEKNLKIDRFDRVIDWGWFYFITKPLFVLIDWLFRFLGNFGLAILAVTVIIKTVFFPLANKSYASMAKMKAVQPQMTAIRERYANDKARQQQELMNLYKTEKINPVAGCLPIMIQIPVFFALYKVLFVTIEMRHAPFYGWIKDLAAPDPTNLFNLFGLIPYDPTHIPLIGHFLVLGIWPLIMGVTMFVQMKLNPAPPDPTQKMIFDWMPLIFTFMLASFPAGLVIYWAWNNTLSVIQQSVIMKKHGAKIELFDNIKALFAKKDKPAGP